MAKLTYCLYQPELGAKMQTLASMYGMNTASVRIPRMAAHATEQACAYDKIRRIFEPDPEQVLLILPSIAEIKEACAFVRKMYPDMKNICNLIGVHQKKVPEKLDMFRNTKNTILILSTVTALSDHFPVWPTNIAFLWRTQKGLDVPFAHKIIGQNLYLLDILPENGKNIAQRLETAKAGFTQTEICDLYTVPDQYLAQAKSALSPSEPVWEKEENEALVKALHHLSQIKPNKTAASVLRQAFLNGMELPAALFAIPEKSAAWTPAEDDILRQFYLIEFDSIIERLPGRTAEAAGARAKAIGIMKNTVKRQSAGGAWREDENIILKNFYPTEGPKCADRLPGRTRSAVRHQANKLGLFKRQLPENTTTRSNGWTAEQNDILASYGPEEGVMVYKRLPGKSPGAVRSRAARMGVALAKKKDRVQTENNKIQ